MVNLISLCGVIKQNDKSHLATLVWIGELPGKKGSWYGIVYDEPQAWDTHSFDYKHFDF